MTKSQKTAAEAIWEGDEPFPDNSTDETTLARKRRKSTDAEIVLPESEYQFLPEPTDDQLGELIDGSEDDITALEEQDDTALLVSDVGDEDSFPAEDDEETSDATQKEDVPMAEKKAKKTKADYIRDEIKAMRAKGSDKIRPRDIIANLEKKGVKVTAPQVSVTLRDFDKETKTTTNSKPTKTAAVAATAAEPRSRATAKVAAPERPRAVSATASVEELEAVSGFVSSMGGVDRARSMLDAYAAYSAALARA